MKNLITAKKYARAIEALIITMSINTGVFASNISDAEELLLKGKWDKLYDLSGSWISSAPDEPAPYYFRQFACYATNRINEAYDMNGRILNIDRNGNKFRPDAERLLSANPENAYANILMEYAAYYAGEYLLVKELLEKAISISPKYGPAYYDLAVVYEYLKDNAKSLEIIKEGIEKDPYFLGNYFYAGLQYERKNDYSSAEKMYEEAIKKDKKHRTVSFHRQLAMLYMKRAADKEAVKVLQKALKLQPEDIESSVILGDALKAMGDFEEANRVWSAALKEISGGSDRWEAALNTRLRKLEKMIFEEGQKK